MGTERFSRAATSDREKQNGLSSKHLTEESQPATAATTAVAAANSGKSLLILMSKGDMVNGERLTPEVEREREKVTTWESRRNRIRGSPTRLQFKGRRPA